MVQVAVPPTAEEVKRSEARDWGSNLPGWATWTAAEAEAYIEANVVDLASAKAVLVAMAKAIVYLRDHTVIVH